MALFENYEGRMPQLQPVLEKYGFKDFDDVKAFNNSKGVDAYSIVESTQPICFENAKWAYELGAAIAMKKGVTSGGTGAPPAGGNLGQRAIARSTALSNPGSPDERVFRGAPAWSPVGRSLTL